MASLTEVSKIIWRQHSEFLFMSLSSQFEHHGLEISLKNNYQLQFMKPFCVSILRHVRAIGIQDDALFVTNHFGPPCALRKQHCANSVTSTKIINVLKIITALHDLKIIAALLDLWQTVCFALPSHWVHVLQSWYSIFTIQKNKVHRMFYDTRFFIYSSNYYHSDTINDNPNFNGFTFRHKVFMFQNIVRHA